MNVRASQDVKHRIVVAIVYPSNMAVTPFCLSKVLGIFVLLRKPIAKVSYILLMVNIFRCNNNSYVVIS